MDSTYHYQVKDTSACPYCFTPIDTKTTREFQLIICKKCGRDFEVREVIMFEFR